MKSVLASIIVQAYAMDFGLCQKLVSCDGARVVGFEWFVPIVENGLLKGYRNVVLATKPTPDSIKTIKVIVEGGRQLNVAVADDAPLTAFSDACNACCDQGTPTIAAPAVPAVLYEEWICADANGHYLLAATAPVLISGQKLQITAATCNGVPADPLPPNTGFANLAAVLSFVNANYSELGTFEVKPATGGNTAPYLLLTSTDCAKASLVIELLKQHFCATFSFPVTYDTIIANGVTKTLPASVTAANMTELIGQLASSFADGQITSTITNKLDYYGTGVPASLKLGTTNKATFTAGACS